MPKITYFIFYSSVVSGQPSIHEVEDEEIIEDEVEIPEQDDENEDEGI